MTRTFAAVAFLTMSGPAFAAPPVEATNPSPSAPPHAIIYPKGTYFIVANAWTCEGPGAIEDAERLDNNNVSAEEVHRVTDTPHCLPGGSQDSPVNVMRVDGKFVYLCDEFVDCGQFGSGGHTVFCNYGLVSDIRDSDHHTVTAQQLAEAAAGKTMNDVKELFPTRAPHCSDHRPGERTD